MRQQQSTPIQSIAILRLSALGDVCMMIPLVLQLKQHFPHCSIYWIISESVYPIVSGLPGIRFVVIKKPKCLRDFLRLKKQLRPFHFDVLLLAQASMRAHLVSRCVRANTKYGYGPLHQKDGHRWCIDKTVLAKPEHTVDGFLRFGHALGVAAQPARWQLPLPESVVASVKRQSAGLSRPVTVCLTASKQERDWPVARYVLLLKQLKSMYHITPILIGDNTARATSAAHAVMAQVPDCMNLVGQTNLIEMAAWIGSSHFLIAPDTGPVHVATALDIPVVGLYAVASAVKSGPYHSHAWVVDQYAQAVDQLIGRSADQLPWQHRLHHPLAMTMIEVEEVYQRCALLCASW